MDTDRNLLFGVLALQADLINSARFAEACSAWALCKDTSLVDLLVERGWLTPADRADVEKLLDRKLKKHGGDAKAGLAEVTNDQVRQSLAGVAGLAGKEGSGLTAEEGRGAADAALESLRQAVAAGHRNRDALRSDASLDALRPREDFRKLMQDLEPKGNEGGP